MLASSVSDSASARTRLKLRLSRYQPKREGREFAPIWYYIAPMDVGVPFVVRRARLLMGMTQAEFAGLFGVDDGTVSRWERGKLHPASKVWRRIRNITLKEDSLRDEALVRASPVW